MEGSLLNRAESGGEPLSVAEGRAGGLSIFVWTYQIGLSSNDSLQWTHTSSFESFGTIGMSEKKIGEKTPTGKELIE